VPRPLYVTDLDGTLLLPDATLGDHTRTVLARLASGGALITYATARSFQSAGAIMRGTDLRLPVITYGGAITVDPRSGTAADAARIPAAAVEDTLRVLEAHAVAPLVFALHEGRDRVCWLEHDTSAGIRDFLARRPGDPRMLPLRSWSEIDLSAVFYLSAIDHDRSLLARIEVELGAGVHQACHVILGEDVYAKGQFWLELTAAGATKAAAVLALAARLDADRIVCFGDNLNDLPMFAIADESYAVANALPQVRAAATGVIGSNADEAVARWLSAASAASAD
jgi:Cof subfamily protein (haloacid dehalogenase superfamily)